MIDKLKQIERLKLYNLLCDTSNWSSLFIEENGIERLFCTIGKYKIFLNFIHKLDGNILTNNHQSATHILGGECEIKIGDKESPTTIISNGSVYFDALNDKNYHCLTPIVGVISSVMLVTDDYEEIDVERNLHNDRVVIMIEYFKSKYQNTVKNDDILDEVKRGDWVMLDERKMNKDDHEEYGEIIGKKGFVIKNSRNEGLSIRFDRDRYDEFNPKVLKKLEKPEE